MQAFGHVVNDSFDLFEQTNLTARCFSSVILPTGDTVIQDGTNTTGASVFQEFWYTMVAFASDAQGFDGNGSYTRTATGGGDILIRTGKLSDRPKNRDILYGHALNPPLGHAPEAPVEQAAVQDERRLLQERQARPQRARGGRRAAGQGGQVRLAIQKNLREFIAVIVMVILAMFVGGYILSNQRFYLPAWVPVLGTDFFELKAEFATAQSVTPGQGQTVQIAGVSVGEIKKVNLKDGRAVVTLAVRRKYADMIKQDATMLLRPKTGLKDMVIEMDPGTQTLPAVEEGFTIPVAQTEPDVNLDEILASLDRDTRDYLRLLIAGGGEGLKNNGRNFANAFRRFEPLNRDVAKLTGELTKRRKNLGRLIHNLQLLVTEVGTKDKELAELIVSQNAVFEAFANQDANLREFLRELPNALQTTNKALTQSTKLTDQLGPALKKLRPGARALAPAQRAQRPFARQTIPPIKNQIRPFARAAQPTVAELKPALQDFEKVTPKLATTFDVLNEVFDALTYNPKGTTQEGYLFWAYWLNHIGASVYTTQDAHGLIRRGIIFTDCIALGALEATRTAGCPARHADRPLELRHESRRPAARPCKNRLRQSAASSSCRSSRCRASACCCTCGRRSAARCR